LFSVRKSQSLSSSPSDMSEEEPQIWQYAFSRAIATAKGSFVTQSWPETVRRGFWRHSQNG